MKHSDLVSIDQLNIGFEQLQDQGTLREVIIIIITMIIIIKVINHLQDLVGGLIIIILS